MGRMRGGSQRCCERGGTRERDRQPRHACMQRAYAPYTFGPRSEAGGPHTDYVTLLTFGPRSEAGGPHTDYVTLLTFGPRSEAGGPHTDYVTLLTFGPRSEARDRTDAGGFYGGVRSPRALRARRTAVYDLRDAGRRQSWVLSGGMRFVGRPLRGLLPPQPL
jgi:hypothetical protein